MPRNTATRSASRTPDRPSRLRLWLRRRRTLARPSGVLALGLGGIGALLFGLYAVDPVRRAEQAAEALANTALLSGLTVQTVVIEGRENAPLEFVRSAIGISRGDPMLGFSPHAARERLERIGWILSADVSLRLPSTVHVRIEERRPFAFWQNRGRFSVIDREGRVVATERLSEFGALPLVVGAGADKKAAALYDILKEHKDVAERTQAMVRIAERRWNLRLHNGADVMLPEGAEAAAIQRLAEMQRDQRIMDRQLVAIDMRLPDRMIVRPPAPPEPPANARTTGGRRT